MQKEKSGYLVDASRTVREEHIAIALRMIKKGTYTTEQIMEKSSLTEREVQGLFDMTAKN